MICLYGQLNQENFKDFDEHISPAYFILHFFGSDKYIDDDVLMRLYIDNFKSDELQELQDRFIGPFVTFESLNQYIYSVCEKMALPEIFLLSIENYNEALRDSSNRDELILKSKALSQKLSLNSDMKNKGIFQRIFG